MRILLIYFSFLMISPSCHRKELPSTKLRKEMRASNEKSIKAAKKQMKKNKKAVGKGKRS